MINYKMPQGLLAPRAIVAVMTFGAFLGAVAALLPFAHPAAQQGRSVENPAVDDNGRPANSFTDERGDALKAMLSTHNSHDLQATRNALKFLRVEMENYRDSDFQQAVELLASRQLGDTQIALFEELFGEWGCRGPYTAIATAETMAPNLRLRALRSTLSAWMRMDSASARDWLRQLPSEADKSHLINHLCITLGPENMSGIMAIIDENKLPNSDQLRGTLLQVGASFDPHFSIEMALKNPTNRWMQSSLGPAIAALMQSEPEAARLLLEKASSASVRRSLLTGMLDYYAREAPLKGLALASKEWGFLSDKDRDYALYPTLRRNLGEAFKHDNAKMLEWLALQPEDSLKQQLALSITRNIPAKERPEILDKLMESDLLNDGNLQTLTTLFASYLDDNFSNSLR